MAPRLRHYSFATATLLFCITFPMQLVGISLRISVAQAQTQTIQDSKAEVREWQKFTSTKGGFSVLMPAVPTETVKPGNPQEGKGESHQFLLGLENENVYMVEYIEFPNLPSQLMPSQIDEFLNAFRDGAVKNNRLLKEQSIALDGYPGREIEVETSNQIIKIRAYWTHSRLYALAVVAAKEEADRFFNSFRLVADRAIETPGALAPQNLMGVEIYNPTLEALNSAVTGRSTKMPSALTQEQATQKLGVETEGNRPQFSCDMNYDNIRNNPRQTQERLQSLEQELKRYQATKNRQSEAEVLDCIAYTSNELGQYDRAVKAYEELLPIVREKGEISEEARVLERLTSIYKPVGDSKFSCEAVVIVDPGWAQTIIQSYEQKLKHYQATENRWGEGAVLDCLANTYMSLGQPERAIEPFRQVLAWQQELASVTGAVHGQQFVCELGDELQNNPKQAQERLQSLEEELKHYQATGNRDGESAILYCLASTYEHVGQDDRALEFWQQELVLEREISKKLKALGWKLGWSRAEAQTLYSLGSIYERLQLPSRAVEFYKQLLALAQEIGEREEEKRALEGLAGAYFRLNQYVRAIEAYERFLVLVKKSDEPYEEASALETIASVYEQLNQYERVVKIYERLLELTRNFNNRSDKLWITTSEESIIKSLGNAYLKLGQYDRAIKFFEQQLIITQKQGNPTQSSIIYYMGDVYVQLGQYEQAFKLFEQQLVLARKQGDRGGEISVLSYLANAYASQGQHNKAIEILQEQLALAQELSHRCEEQLKDNQTTSWGQIRCHLTEEKTLNTLANAYLFVGNYSRAIDIYEKILTNARKNSTPEIEMRTLNNLSWALSQSGKLAEAETASRSALDILEWMWKSFLKNLYKEESVTSLSILDRQQPLFNNLQRVLIAQNKLEQALEISERSRARVLVGLLTRGMLPKTAQPPTNRAQTLRDDLLRYDLPEINPIEIEKIKQTAQVQQATLVEYSINYDEFLYIWVVKPTGEVAFQQVDIKSLNTLLKDLITNTRQSIGVRGRDSLDISFEPGLDQSKRLQQLHKLLIEPIAQYLPTDPNEHVIFIPHGELFSVPFPALQDASGKYLIQKHTILTAPSIQLLQLTREKRKAVSGNGVLVVGNPTMPSVGVPSEQLRPLPGAEAEASKIASTLKTSALTGKQATETTVRQQMEKARIIHLATHGLLDDFGYGVPGAIALAPTGSDDGLLSAREIFEMKLSAELVVLSACDTGGGKITGDGVIGLSRSLITAGVPSIIVSLWSVPDAPTASLMTQFYQNLQKNPDKAQALRQAMLTTMATHPNPRDWAAFTLIGEAQ